MLIRVRGIVPEGLARFVLRSVDPEVLSTTVRSPKHAIHPRITVRVRVGGWGLVMYSSDAMRHGRSVRGLWMTSSALSVYAWMQLVAIAYRGQAPYVGAMELNVNAKASKGSLCRGPG